MGNPYPAEQAQLRRLTAKGKATLQELNDRDESKMDELRQVRADLMAEVVSVDDVMADLRESIDRRKAKMCGDVISLLPTDSHRAESSAPSSTDSPPEGDCAHCGKPVWRVSTSEAAPDGLIHAWGATCNPDDPNSGTATLRGFGGAS